LVIWAAGFASAAGNATNVTIARQLTRPGTAEPLNRRVSPDVPTGYQIITNANIPLPAGAQGHGAAVCPAGTIVYGGGVKVASSSSKVYTASSWPLTDGSQWNLWVDNAGSTATTFTVYAICGAEPSDWRVESQSVGVAAGSAVGQVITQCPFDVKLLGGGIF